METIEILEFEVILDAEGKLPSGKANSMLYFHVKILMNINAGTPLGVRVKVDGVETLTPPWSDDLAPRDYVNEIWEGDGSVQLDADLGVNAVFGHSLQIIYLWSVAPNYASSEIKSFLTAEESEIRPLLALVGVLSGVAIGGIAWHILYTS